MAPSSGLGMFFLSVKILTIPLAVTSGRRRDIWKGSFRGGEPLWHACIDVRSTKHPFSRLHPWWVAYLNFDRLQVLICYSKVQADNWSKRKKNHLWDRPNKRQTLTDECVFLAAVKFASCHHSRLDNIAKWVAHMKYFQEQIYYLRQPGWLKER